MIRKVIVALSFSLVAGGVFGADSLATLKLHGPYLGLSAPGATPELFAPGIISTDGVQHSVPVFSPDGSELYWTNVERVEGRPKSKIWFMKETPSGWTAPALAPFTGEFHDQAPMFSPDGKRLYFSSFRPDGDHRGRSLWYLDRTDDGWSEPKRLASPEGDSLRPSQLSVTDSGEMLFVGRADDKEWSIAIYSARLSNSGYTQPVMLDDRFNTPKADSYPFIAPDGSYLLFGSSRPGGRSTETDLYIARRSDDGSWNAPVHLPESINNGHTVSFSWVSSDGKYLFFNRFDDDGTDKFYWVSAEILREQLIE